MISFEAVAVFLLSMTVGCRCQTPAGDPQQQLGLFYRPQAQAPAATTDDKETGNNPQGPLTFQQNFGFPQGFLHPFNTPFHTQPFQFSFGQGNVKGTQDGNPGPILGQGATVVSEPTGAVDGTGILQNNGNADPTPGGGGFGHFTGFGPVNGRYTQVNGAGAGQGVTSGSVVGFYGAGPGFGFRGQGYSSQQGVGVSTFPSFGFNGGFPSHGFRSAPLETKADEGVKVAETSNDSDKTTLA